MRLRRRGRLPLPADPDCHEVRAVLEAYLDGELGPDDAEAVTAHLAHCARCGVEADTVAKVIAVIERQRPDIDPEAIRRLAGFVDDLSSDGGSHRPE